jgi:hypothetical protein
LTYLGTRARALPKWVKSNFDEYFSRTPVQIIHDWLDRLNPNVELVKNLEIPHPADILRQFTKNEILTNRKGVTDFLVILCFLKTYLDVYSQPWTLESYLEYRKDMYGKLIESIEQESGSQQGVPTTSLTTPPSENAKQPPKYSKISPTILRLESSDQSHHSYKTIPPTMYSHTQGLVFNSSPLSARSEGDNLSFKESPSLKKALDELDAMKLSEYYDEQMGEKTYRSKIKIPKRDVDMDEEGSVRSRRSVTYKRYEQPPKSRSNVNSDKLQWDGHRSTYPTFAADLEGTMLRLGAGYMFDKDVMDTYTKEGISYIKSDIFWDEHGISVKQFLYDIRYLFGLLQSATKTISMTKMA